MQFWRKAVGNEIDLEAKLRTTRSKPRSEFTAALSERIEGSGRRFTKQSIVLACALTVTIVAALAAFGGIGYAANGGKKSLLSTYKAVKATVVGLTEINTQKVSGGPDPKNRADKAKGNSGNGNGNKSGKGGTGNNSNKGSTNPPPPPKTNCSTGQQAAANQYCTNTHSKSKQKKSENN